MVKMIAGVSIAFGWPIICSNVWPSN